MVISMHAFIDEIRSICVQPFHFTDGSGVTCASLWSAGPITDAEVSFEGFSLPAHDSCAGQALYKHRP
jgi:hypothetical protein